ncbi:MAG: histidine triad nucleotide-binding protein [Magnetococcales bacterium]|nr:histidine triad nucleotide-binding protein [Magnetococcales bacterium]
MTTDCLFCKIVAKNIPSTIIYEDEHVFAFEDIAPQAPVHVLVIPKKHIASLDLVKEEDRETMGVVMERTAHIARMLKVNEKGYRTIINTNGDGGQVVYHIHVHILGGKPIGAMVSR